MGNICIGHLLVDGYSRRVMYAFAACNKLATTVELAYRWVTQIYGFPFRLRTDYGGENNLAHQLHLEHWATTPGNIYEGSTVLTGASVHNQRVERVNRDVNSVLVPLRKVWMAELADQLDGAFVQELPSSPSTKFSCRSSRSICWSG